MSVTSEPPPPAQASEPKPVRSVDDFAPDEALDASFLDDTKDVKDSKATAQEEGDRSVNGIFISQPGAVTLEILKSKANLKQLKFLSRLKGAVSGNVEV